MAAMRAWAEISIVTIISLIFASVLTFGTIGILKLSDIHNCLKPLDKLGEDALKEAVDQIDEIYDTLVAMPPSYDPAKVLDITKTELLEKKQVVSIPKGDYRILKISVRSGEELAIESQMQSPGTVKFHLVNSEGNVKGFVLGRKYKPSLLCAGSTETYYFYLNNSSDSINYKSVWIQLVPRENINQK